MPAPDKWPPFEGPYAEVVPQTSTHKGETVYLKCMYCNRSRAQHVPYGQRPNPGYCIDATCPGRAGWGEGSWRCGFCWRIYKPWINNCPSCNTHSPDARMYGGVTNFYDPSTGEYISTL